MTAPNTTNNVTVRKLADVAEGMWNKSKNAFVNASGDTMTGRLTMENVPINQIVTGTGTAATSSSSGGTTTYYPAKWQFDLGIATPSAGDQLVIKIPVAGHDNGTFMSTDNGTTYFPVAQSTGATRFTTRYPVNAYVFVVFEEYTGSTNSGQVNDCYALAGSTGRSAYKVGCWRVVNDYDSGNNYERTYLYSVKYYAGSTGIKNKTLICLDKAGTFSMLTSAGSGQGSNKTINTDGKFKLDAVILFYIGNDTAANALAASNSSGYVVYPSCDARYSYNPSGAMVANKPLYIECTVDDDGFWSPTTKCITQTLEMGKYYIFLGLICNDSSYTFALAPQHPLYYYDGTNLTERPNKVEASQNNGNIKINGTETNVYTHPTDAGNKHIPAGGSSGQFLGWDSAGTAKWVNNPNTDIKVKATAKTDDANYKILATASASPTSGSATEAVYDTDITLNPSTNTISANVSGTAASAGKLTTARTTYVTLGTSSTSTTRDWSGTTTIPVSGTLGLGNGGTGATSAAGARTNLDVYSKSETESLLNGKVVVVTQLPETGESGVTYYVKDTSSSAVDKYDEYIWAKDAGASTESWIHVGEKSIDLSNYVNALSTSGSGPLVASLSKSGNTLTATMGTISIDDLSDWATETDVTVSSVTYHTWWPVAPTSSNQVYGLSIYNGRLYRIYNNKGTYSAQAYDTNTTYTNKSLGQGYGTCATDTATAAKIVTMSDYALTIGGIVTVKFTNALCASATMSINGKGAKPIYIKGAAVNNDNAATVSAGDTAYFMYDGTAYHLLGTDRAATNPIVNISRSGTTFTATRLDGTTFTFTQQDNNTTYTQAKLGQGYGTCTTAEATAAKSVTLTGYELELNGVVAVKFTNGLCASATMSINGKTATPIYINGAAVTTTSCKEVLAGDLAFFIYDGSHYQFICTDRISKNGITGLSISGRTITYTRADGTTGTLTTQDTTYTFDGVYNSSSNKAATVSTVTNAVNALDVDNITGFGAGKTLATLTETDGKIAATFQNISITKSQVSDFSHSHGNITNDGKVGTTADYAVVTTTGGAVTATSLATSSPTTSGNTLEFIDTVSQNSKGKISATKKKVTIDDTYSSTGTNPVSGKAIAAAIETLDVTEVGGDGQYIKKIKEDNGKITATVETMDTTPTASSTKAVTSGGIKTALDGKADNENAVYYVVGSNSYATYSSSSTYTATTSSGPFDNTNSCIYSDYAYYCTTTISTGEAWTSSHWAKIPTAVWLGTNSAITSLYAGLKIAYKVPSYGGSSVTQLNINGLGAKTVYRCTGNTTTHLPKNTIVFLTYDGNYWRWADYNSDSWVTTIGAYCETGAGTAAKTASSTNTVLTAGMAFLTRFTNTNTAASKLTLNVNSQGAKDLWINGAVSSASNCTLVKGEYWTYYDGTKFLIWTDGTVHFKGLHLDTPLADTEIASAANWNAKEDASNKVTTWSETTTDVHYPSEKLVKTDLDNRIDRYDAVYNRNNTAGDGWVKLADLAFSRTSQVDKPFVWDVVISKCTGQSSTEQLTLNVRYNLSGLPNVYFNRYYNVDRTTTHQFAIVTNEQAGLLSSGNGKVELWAYLENHWGSIAIREMAGSQSTSLYGQNSVIANYYSYTMEGGTTKPVADLANYVQVIDSTNIKMASTDDVSTAITNAINALDVSSAGGDGKYIKAISETNGIISATAETMDTAPTASSTKAVTSGGVKTALDGKATKPVRLTFTLPVAPSGGTSVKYVKITGNGGDYRQWLCSYNGKVSSHHSTWLFRSYSTGESSRDSVTLIKNGTASERQWYCSAANTWYVKFTNTTTGSSFQIVFNVMAIDTSALPTLEAVDTMPDTATEITVYGVTKAEQFRTARQLAVSLSNTGTTTTFDGTANVTNIKVSGTLGVGNGGTGKSSVTAGNYLVGNGSSALTEKTPAQVLSDIGAQAALSFEGTYNASTNKVATVSTVTNAIDALDAEVTSSDGKNVNVKVTETNGKVTAVNVTTDTTANIANSVYYVVGTLPFNTYSASATYTKYESGAYTTSNACIYNNYAYYCSTAITTAEAWNSAHWTRIATVVFTASIPEVTDMVAGLKIAFKFPCYGGSTSTQLAINTLAAKDLRRNTGNITTHIPPNAVAFFGYNGTYWSWADYYSDSWVTTMGAYCDTAATTAAKTATSSNTVLTAGMAFLTRFTKSNTYAGKLTLNVNSQGAKDVYINGSISSSTNYTLPAGEHWCFYDGTYWYIWTNGTVQFKGVHADSYEAKYVTDANSAIPPLITTGNTGGASADFVCPSSATNIPNTSYNWHIHSIVARVNSDKYRLTQLATASASVAAVKMYERNAWSSDGTTWTFASWSELLTSSSSLAASKITGTLSVEHGGTGKSSVTANSYLKGNGTGALVERTYAQVRTDLNVSDGANKVEASSTNGNIKIDGTETTVYTHPSQTAYTSKGSATKVPQITTDATGHVTGITEVTISGVTPASHTHGNISNTGTLTDTATAAAGNDYVVIRDADNAKIQTSTIKGTDVADAVSKKHAHSTLTLSTTAQAYDGTHTLALPASDPYTSARTPTEHQHEKLSYTNWADAVLPNNAEGGVLRRFHSTGVPNYCSFIKMFDVTQFYDGTIVNNGTEQSTFIGDVSFIRTGGGTLVQKVKVVMGLAYASSWARLYGDSKFCHPVVIKDSRNVLSSWIVNNYIPIGDVGSTVSLTPTANNNLAYCVIDCSNYSTMYVNVYSLTGASAWAFIDSSNTILSKSSGTAANATLTVPQGAVKLICNVKNTADYLNNCYAGAESESPKYYLALRTEGVTMSCNMVCEGRFFTRTTATATIAARPLLTANIMVPNYGSSSTSLPAGYTTQQDTSFTDVAGTLGTARELAVSLSNTSTTTKFDGSANVTNIKVGGTLGLGNGGTGATSAPSAEYNINAKANTELTGAMDGDKRILFAAINPSTSVGRIAGYRTADTVWNYFKTKFSYMTQAEEDNLITELGDL